jgi:hypothetical protein
MNIIRIYMMLPSCPRFIRFLRADKKNFSGQLLDVGVAEN